MTNQFNDISSEVMEEMQETSESPSPFKPDDHLIEKRYEWDSSGLYKPYTFRYENNPDQRDIYLKIERIPDKKTDFIIYSWNNKVNGEFKRLNFFRRDLLPVEEEIEKGGKSSINRKLSHTGRLASLDAEEGTYKRFFEELIRDIINSDGLEVFKELDYIFPVPDAADDDEDDDLLSTESEILAAIDSRINPELTDEEIKEAMEVKDQIHEKGLIIYWDGIIDHFHVGNHKVVYRKHLGGVSVIRGGGSYYINTTAKHEGGKSLEDEIAFLKMIPKRYIYKKNKMSLSAFSRKADVSPRFFERMIIYFGDLGNKKAYEKIEEVFDAIKILITEGEYSTELTDGKFGSFEGKSLDLIADSIGAVYQTVRNDFLGDEEGQIDSRSINATPLEANVDEVLDLKFALKMPESKQIKKQEEMTSEFEKYHLYLLWLIKEGIRVVNPYRSYFKKCVKKSQYVFRDLDQICDLFESYCILTFEDCDKINGRLIASEDQLKTFMDELNVDNVLPPVESNFLKMLISEGNKTALKIFDEIDEDDEDADNPLEEYEQNAMEELGYYQNTREYYEGKDETKHVYNSIGDLDSSKRQSAIAKLLEMYRLGGTGMNHTDNVFFRISDIRRIHSSKRAFQDVDNIRNLLDKLFSYRFLDKHEFRDDRRQNIYYLTAKCKEINNPIELEEDDRTDAKIFMAEQGLINAEYDEEKAERGEKKAE